MSNLLAIVVSNSTDGDLCTYTLDAAQATLLAADRYAAGPHVMPMSVSPDRAVLYAALRGQPPRLARYALDARTGQLTPRDVLDIDAGHVSLATDRTGRLLFGASYGGHRLVAYDVARLDHGDTAPRQTLPDIRNAHAVIVSPDNRFVYVSSLGSDTLVVCSLDAARNAPLAIIGTEPLEPGFGPRHMRFSPDGAWLYVLSEFRATVAVFRRDAASGRLSLHEVSTRPPALAALHDGRARPPANEPQPDPATLASAIWAADLHVHPDGRFVYLSERTTSRLFVLRVGPNGSLSHAGAVDTEAQPRGFAIDPSGRYLVASGEQSAQVSLYRIDSESGVPALYCRQPGGHGANWVEIVPLEL